MKVLVADDSVEIRVLVKTILEGHGYEVLLAENGSEALKTAVKEKPDIILMDIVMPGMDGTEATLRLKNNPETKNIPVIMLTAVMDSKIVLQSYDYGADHYLNKPFDKQQLLKAMDFVEKMENRGL